jgi:hypothetical protein
MQKIGEDIEVHNPAVVVVTDGIPSTVEEADEIESFITNYKTQTTQTPKGVILTSSHKIKKRFT